LTKIVQQTWLAAFLTPITLGNMSPTVGNRGPIPS
jgi:hypothetical protein